LKNLEAPHLPIHDHQVATKSPVTSALIVPNARAIPARIQPRRPVGSKKTGLPVIGEHVEKQRKLAVRSQLTTHALDLFLA
jgi:hypothetical protein